MKNDAINEAFFWKHLADTLLEHSNIDKELFYERLEPVKAIWDIDNIDIVTQDILKASRNKTSYVKESFNRILLNLKSENRNSGAGESI